MHSRDDSVQCGNTQFSSYVLGKVLYLKKKNIFQLDQTLRHNSDFGDAQMHWPNLLGEDNPFIYVPIVFFRNYSKWGQVISCRYLRTEWILPLWRGEDSHFLITILFFHLQWSFVRGAIHLGKGYKIEINCDGQIYVTWWFISWSTYYPPINCLYCNRALYSDWPNQWDELLICESYSMQKLSMLWFTGSL